MGTAICSSCNKEMDSEKAYRVTRGRKYFIACSIACLEKMLLRIKM